MKKLIAIILTLCVLFTLAACSGGSETASVDSASNNSSSKPKPLGSAISGTDDDTSSENGGNADELNIEYTSVAEGYIEQNKIVNFKGFQCMDDQYIFIPKGTNIITDKHCAIICVKLLSDDTFEIDIDACKSIGSVIAPSGWSVQHSAGTYQATQDVYARISVKGSLKDDVQICPPKEKLGDVKLFTTAELVEHLKK